MSRPNDLYSSVNTRRSGRESPPPPDNGADVQMQTRPVHVSSDDCFRTQPNTLFAEESDEDEEADKEPEWKKRKI